MTPRMSAKSEGEVELNGDDADHPGHDVKRNADLDEIEVAVAAD